MKRMNIKFDRVRLSHCDSLLSRGFYRREFFFMNNSSDNCEAKEI